jgi:integrase
MGSIYKRGKVWWIKYYLGGRRAYESSGSTKQSDAKRLLALREGQKAEGRVPNPRVEKIRFEDLINLYVQDYEINGKRSICDARRYAKRLGQAFHGLRAIEVTSDRIMTYVASRKAQGKASGTINRELTALKRMFNLGARQTPPMVLQVPHIQMLHEDNIRTGFFEHDEFLTLRGVAVDHLKVAATIAYWTAMRPEEILSLTWDRVDQDEGFIRLEPGTTKNKEGRLIPFTGDLAMVLDAWWRHTRSKYPDCPWVVHYYGRQVKSVKRAWATARSKAGLHGRIFYDFRRTGVRNMVRAGISEHVAMKISGHKTRSVFDRYDIVSETDLREAANRLADKMGTVSGTVDHQTLDKGGTTH